ncbi:MAG: S8 family serine peptidase [Actinomycetota bacterium]|nr:S8 family serine peptidase [Actinomycetota bacterium]
MSVRGHVRAVQHLVAAIVVALAVLLLPSLAAAGAATGDDTTMVVVERDANGELIVRTYTVDQSTSGAFSAAAAGDPDVVAMEPIGSVHAFVNDSYRSNQWALDRLSFEASWATADGTGVVVAVVDTGIRATHEDLVGKVLPGADFISPGGDGTLADHYHGSHVAGIIGAHANNGVGIAGGAPGVQILPIRALDGSGTGTTAGVASAIIWAVDNGADVVNLSLGSSSDSSVIRAAVDHAEANDVVVVAAAGNAGHLGNPVTYPAAIPEVLAVSATESNNNRAYFSNHGTWIDVAAPGSGIYSLHGDGDLVYASSSGTSMASPYVAAAAALVKASSPSLTAAQIRDVLTTTAIDLGPEGKDDDYGDGLVDPLAAVEGGLAGPDSSWGTGPQPAKDYQVVTSEGRVVRPGTSASAAVSQLLNEPVVGGTPTPSGAGHWLVARDGGIFAYGDARYFGSAGDIALNEPIVAMASTPGGDGYWMVAQDGGLFGFGAARYHGSMGGTSLNEPIVGMAATPSGNGYWMVARDGGIFTFGDATYLGSTGDIALNQPVVGMAPSPTGDGYWLVALDGGIFTFGTAEYGGSLSGQLNPGEFVVGMIHDEL